MQSAQPRLPPRSTNHVFPIQNDEHRSRTQPPVQRVRQIRFGAETIDDHAHINATRDRRDQRIGNPPAGGVVSKDIGLDVNAPLRLIDGVNDGRKILRAASQQRDAVTPDERVHVLNLSGGRRIQ